MTYTMDSRPLLGGKPNQKTIYIRIDGIEAGTFPMDAKSEYVAAVGPRMTYRQHGCDFPVGSKPGNVWSFNFKDAHRSSFVVALYKKRILGGDIMIGELEINVAQFTANFVNTLIFTLKSADPKYIPPRVKLTVHISDNGMQRFCAPYSGAISSYISAPSGVACY